MSTIYNGTVTYTFQFEDRDRNKRSCALSFLLPDTTTLANIVAYGDVVAAELVPLSNANYLGLSLAINTRESVVPAGLAVEASDVERKGLFSFFNIGGGVSSFQIPSIDNTLVTDETQRIATGQDAVDDFIAVVLNGPPGLGNGAGTATGLNFEAFKEAFKIHKGSSKG